LAYLDNPEAESIYDGSLLHQVISTVVEPPTAWNCMLKLYLEDGFINGEKDVEAFAWLCLKIAVHRGTDLVATLNEVAEALKKSHFSITLPLKFDNSAT
jgi:hypothetical protein